MAHDVRIGEAWRALASDPSVEHAVTWLRESCRAGLGLTPGVGAADMSRWLKPAVLFRLSEFVMVWVDRGERQPKTHRWPRSHKRASPESMPGLWWGLAFDGGRDSSAVDRHGGILEAELQRGWHLWPSTDRGHLVPVRRPWSAFGVKHGYEHLMLDYLITNATHVLLPSQLPEEEKPQRRARPDTLAVMRRMGAR